MAKITVNGTHEIEGSAIEIKGDTLILDGKDALTLEPGPVRIEADGHVTVNADRGINVVQRGKSGADSFGSASNVSYGSDTTIGSISVSSSAGGTKSPEEIAAKQAARDAKHQAKAEAREAKQEAKAAKLQAKLAAKFGD